MFKFRFCAILGQRTCSSSGNFNPNGRLFLSGTYLGARSRLEVTEFILISGIAGGALGVLAASALANQNQNRRGGRRGRRSLTDEITFPIYYTN
jgi:hypothetical protein